MAPDVMQHCKHNCKCFVGSLRQSKPRWSTLVFQAVHATLPTVRLSPQGVLGRILLCHHAPLSHLAACHCAFVTMLSHQST